MTPSPFKIVPMNHPAPAYLPSSIELLPEVSMDGIHFILQSLKLDSGGRQCLGGRQFPEFTEFSNRIIGF